MKKIKYVSIFHYCRGGKAAYHISFNRGGDAHKDPTYKRATPTSLKRLARIFWRLEDPQPSFASNFVHIQAYVKEKS